MATVVEHDKRREEILDRSLDVFMDEGYEDVTFQKIADRCGITRTTLYIYFKNKREIFLFSIKQFLSTLEESLIKIATDTTISTEKVLKSMLRFILEKCEENRKLFAVLLPYLVQLQKSGINTEERVLRRTIRLQHLMNCVIIRGIRSGEFKKVSLFSIKQFLSTLEESLIKIATDTTISTEKVLKSMLRFILEKCEENRKLFAVLLPYLVQLQKSGINTEERVLRRTIRLQHLMNCVIIRGIRSGEFKKVSVKYANVMLYSQLESAIFKIAVLNSKNITDCYGAAELTVNGLLKNQSE